MKNTNAKMIEPNQIAVARDTHRPAVALAKMIEMLAAETAQRLRAQDTEVTATAEGATREPSASG